MLKCNKEGKCTFCGSEDLDYGALIPDDTGVIYPWTCEACGATGEEAYNIEFAGHYNLYNGEEHIPCASDEDIEADEENN